MSSPRRAAATRTSICYEQHQKAQDILDGRKHDPTFYPVLYSAPEDADWTDPKVWAMANPSIGRTVDLEYYQQRLRVGEGKPGGRDPVSSVSSLPVDEYFRALDAHGQMGRLL